MQFTFILLHVFAVNTTLLVAQACSPHLQESVNKNKNTNQPSHTKENSRELKCNVPNRRRQLAASLRQSTRVANRAHAQTSQRNSQHND
jgi:hypothetical protein